LVLFAAGLPLQGGTNHINEQWPEYWWKHFKARGYEVVDFIRREFWNNSRVHLATLRIRYCSLSPLMRSACRD